MRKKRESPEDAQAESFSSMIDIVFLLLIFFIVQPFRAPEMRLRSELPRLGPSTPPGLPKPSVRVEIVATGENGEGAEYRIGRQRIQRGEMSSRRLAEAILREANQDRATPVTLAPRSDVEFAHALYALDQCYLAEMEAVNWDAPPPTLQRVRQQ